MTLIRKKFQSLCKLSDSFFLLGSICRIFRKISLIHMKPNFVLLNRIKHSLKKRNKKMVLIKILTFIKKWLEKMNCQIFFFNVSQH